MCAYTVDIGPIIPTSCCISYITMILLVEPTVLYWKNLPNEKVVVLILLNPKI